MRDNRKKRKPKQWTAMIGYLLIGAVCGILIVIYLEHLNGAAKTTRLIHLGMLFLCMYGMLMVHIVIHEAGHLAFGLATGYRFSSFRIFNMMWAKNNGRIRFRKMSIAGTGGQCLMCPPDMKDGKMPVMLYNFGGALMNLIASLVSGVIALVCPAWSFVWMLLAFSVIIGIAFAIINGLPLGAGPVSNDGKNALDLSRSPDAVRAFWIQMKANEQISKGIRLKDMPAEWFEMPSEESMNNGITAAVGVLACNRLMDEHRFEEADLEMERILATENGVNGLYRALLTCDRIYTELIGRNRQEILERMITKEQTKMMKAMKSFPSVLRTEYARALLNEKDADKAEKYRKQFERTAKTYPYPSEIDAERELMEYAAKAAR